MTQPGIDARGGCDLKQFTRKKWRYAQVPYGAWSEMKQMRDPSRTEGKDDGARGDSRENCAWKLKFCRTHESNHVPRGRGGEGIGNQVSAGWSE